MAERIDDRRFSVLPLVVIKEVGVGPAGVFAVLDAIALDSGLAKNVTMADLVDATGADRKTVGKYLAKLAEAGFVLRGGRSEYAVHNPLREPFDRRPDQPSKWGIYPHSTEGEGR